jgi:hypothetical protein
MAGTADDNITPADDWWLASVELAFVTKLVRSERLAKELLLDGLDDGSIRWRCWNLATEKDPSDPCAAPPIRSQSAAYERFFFRRSKNVRVEMDWEISSATYDGPVMRLGSNLRDHDETWPTDHFDPEHTWPIYDLRASITLKASLIRFHHGDVVTRLREMGLAVGAPSPASTPTPIAIVETALAAQQSPTEQPSREPPQEPQSKELKPPPGKPMAKTWVPYAIKRWPQEKDESQSDYVDRLLRHAPKSWTRHTIQNLLSIGKK